MSLTYKSSHSTEAAGQLVEQFKNKTNIVGIVTSIVNRVQDLEDVGFELLNERGLTTAIGEQLNVLGRIVGEKRKNRSDAEFLIGIIVRILRNRTSGTPEEIYEIFNTFRPGVYRLQETYPAAFNLIAQEALTPDDPTPQQFAQLLDDIKAAGVGSHFIYSGYDSGYVFKFASGDTLESDANHGFGNDAGTTGGHWVDEASATGVGEVTLLRLLVGSLIRSLVGDFMITE